jgi:hypothetical protein
VQKECSRRGGKETEMEGRRVGGDVEIEEIGSGSKTVFEWSFATKRARQVYK